MQFKSIGPDTKRSSASSPTHRAGRYPSQGQGPLHNQPLAPMVRVANFRKLSALIGADKIGASLGISVHRLNELMEGQNFSEETAYHIELTLGLPSGYFDQVNPRLDDKEVQRLKRFKVSESDEDASSSLPAASPASAAPAPQGPTVGEASAQDGASVGTPAANPPANPLIDNSPSAAPGATPASPAAAQVLKLDLSATLSGKGLATPAVSASTTSASATLAESALSGEAAQARPAPNGASQGKGGFSLHLASAPVKVVKKRRSLSASSGTPTQAPAATTASPPKAAPAVFRAPSTVSSATSGAASAPSSSPASASPAASVTPQSASGPAALEASTSRNASTMNSPAAQSSNVVMKLPRGVVTEEEMALRQVRTANLVMLTEGPGYKKMLGALTGLSAANISHRLHGNKIFDRETADFFCERLSLPIGWLDTPRKSADVPEQTTALLTGAVQAPPLPAKESVAPVAAPAASARPATSSEPTAASAPEASPAPMAGLTAAPAPVAAPKAPGTTAKAGAAKPASAAKPAGKAATKAKPATVGASSAPSVTKPQPATATKPVAPQASGPQVPEPVMAPVLPAQAPIAAIVPSRPAEVLVQAAALEASPVAEALLKTLLKKVREGKLPEDKALSLLVDVMAL